MPITTRGLNTAINSISNDVSTSDIPNGISLSLSGCERGENQEPGHDEDADDD